MNFHSLAAWQGDGGRDPRASEADPMFVDAGSTGICTTPLATCLAGYKLRPGSPLRDAGIDIHAVYGVVVPSHDFFDAGSGFNIGVDSSP